MVKKVWRGVGQQGDLFEKIDNMLERIRRERGSGSDFLDFKTGAGGMVEAEFLVQALQMEAGVWNSNWSEALRELSERGLLSGGEVENAARSYDFLRRCETVLRRWENKSVAMLPAEANEQSSLAKRLGYEHVTAFANEYVDAREMIHALYQRRIKKISR